MKLDEELMVWRQEWQSSAMVPPDLIRRVERQTAYMRVLRVAEIGVTVTIGSAVLVGAFVHPIVGRDYWAVFAAGTWLLIAIAWLISLHSTREAWTVASHTTASYVALHLRRLRQQVFRIDCGSAFGTMASAFVLLLTYKVLREVLRRRGVAIDPWDFAPFWIVGGVVTVLVLLGQFGKRRRVRAELERVSEFQRRLDNPS
jgi:hypothetical protein